MPKTKFGEIDCQGPLDLNISSQAQGDVIYFNGTDWVRLAKGTAGQVIEMNSGATAPQWAGPGYKFVSATTVTGSTNSGNITIGVDSVYQIFYSCEVTSGNATVGTLLINDDTTGGTYKWQVRSTTMAVSPVNSNTGSNSSGSMTLLPVLSFSTATMIGSIFINTFDVDSVGTHIWGQALAKTTGSTYSNATYAGQYDNTDATSFKIRIGAGSANWKVYLYQLRLS